MFRAPFPPFPAKQRSCRHSRFRTALIVLTAGFLAAVPAPGSQAPPAKPKPNLIVILTDDHGWADLGCQGVRQDIRTPHLDALAAQGVRATHGYVTAPQCVPSRAGLLTGRHQQRFGLESNGEPLDGFNRQKTIAARLKQAGYATGMAGKWHLGPEEEIPRHGFDEVFCTQRSAGSNLRGWANVDLEGRPIPGGPVSPTGLYHVEANSAAACAFIRRHAREPFFFYLAFRAPHTPLDAPGRYTDRFPGTMPERRRQALAALSAVDDGVGRIQATLREHGLERNTLLFFLGDNGAPLKMTMEDAPVNTDAGGWDGSLNAPLNGEKGMLTEGGMRVPWLACWEGRIPPGQVYNHPVISLDIAATAAALAGLPADDQLDGVNLLPFFTGEARGAPHQALHWRWVAQSAIREGRWKWLSGGERSYLFDLETDPGEKRNLLARHPEVAERLRSRLASWANGLQPPGLAVKPMAPTWERHFDFFLDGKPADQPPPRSAWVARNAATAFKDGALHVTPAAEGRQKPFLAFSQLRIPGPARAEISLRCPGGGEAGFAWRLDGQKDFPPGQHVSSALSASPDWQEIALELAAEGEVVHVRALLPQGPCEVRRVRLSSPGKKLFQEWKFDTP